MASQSSGLENLGQILGSANFPAFNRMGVSPAHVQRLLEEGIAYHRAGEKTQAERCYRQVLEIAPNQPDALNLLGVLAAEADMLDLAIGLMERALMTRPKDSGILNNLGHALAVRHRYEDARDKLERALALKPDFDEAKMNLANVLRMIGEPDGALELFTEVWNADDRVFGALVGIVNIHGDQGRFKEAEKAAREVIARLPHRPAGYISLAHVYKFREDDGTLKIVEDLIESDATSTEEKTALHYAAGKICDDMKRFDRAFHHFEAANREAHKAYDFAGVEAFRRQKKTVFSKKFFRERQGWGYQSEVPVFIVGMPRSGTTLTEQILASHPDVFGAGEVETMERMAFFSQQVSPGKEEFPISVLRLTKTGARLVGQRYVDELRVRTDRPVRRITNKMPHNFELLGLIAIALPNAKIIHCRRSPLDTCLSCWTKNFNDAHSYNRSLADLGKYYRGYADLMEHWRQVLPIPMLEIDYEDYTNDLEGTARRMIDFIGLEWDSRCLEFHSVERQVRTASQWQVRQPIYKSSVERWRNYVTDLTPLIEALGPLGKEAAE
jgi:tetratricopeptide (TPR) repeat protein